ncbi:LOW QUALITY PROTEIN: hypothetical protein RvY_19231 [Ramazzottius varieornatus]|uniref:Uncharacterized protein n=1 Tax=Ramazzottius varieornatus TaxID=947166 RepID=A0A1D1W9W8_RAMVA|nr:LOW QUALITY PROTEIN: hypothetical protein RvY_19231 [Ramazzottius varieornatus]
MTQVPSKNGKELVWDVTVVDTQALTNFAMSTVKAGSTADAAEKRKITKYEDIGSQFEFCPVGLETIGPWSPSATALFAAVGRKMAEVTGEPRSFQFFKQRVSIDIQRALMSFERLKAHHDPEIVSRGIHNEIEQDFGSLFELLKAQCGITTETDLADLVLLKQKGITPGAVLANALQRDLFGEAPKKQRREKNRQLPLEAGALTTGPSFVKELEKEEAQKKAEKVAPAAKRKWHLYTHGVELSVPAIDLRIVDGPRSPAVDVSVNDESPPITLQRCESKYFQN